MQLAISVLGIKSSNFVGELLATINACHCGVVELTYTSLNKITTAFVLVDGNWNHVAKLEKLLDGLREHHQVQISMLRPEDETSANDIGVPYTLETISMEKRDLLFVVANFLQSRGVLIEEISAGLHPNSVGSNPVFSTRFMLLVPPSVRIMALREDFLDFCDSINVDAIIEPIKR